MMYIRCTNESWILLDISNSATVVYRTPQAALHARQKIHGFEYPPGERLIVKLSSEMKNFPLLEGPSQTTFDNSTNFCSVNLPPVQPLSKETNCAQRCFIVCSPHTLPVHVLKQVFCRFGNLIDVYLLNNRNCGYVKYATADSAKQASENNNLPTKSNLIFYLNFRLWAYCTERTFMACGSKSWKPKNKPIKESEQEMMINRSEGWNFYLIVHCIHLTIFSRRGVINT